MSEFFVNSAVAWLSAGIVTPFFLTKKFIDWLTFGTWGLLFSIIFLAFSLYFSKEIKQ